MDTQPHMSAARLADLRAATCRVQDPNDAVPELLDEVERLRARIEVTDEDIRAAGLGNPDVCVGCPRLDAWISGQAPGLRAEPAVGIYRVLPSGDRRLIHRGSAMAHDHIINAIAEAIDRPPLDVLDEIAAQGDGTVEHDIPTIAQLDRFVGRWVQLGFHSWTYRDSPMAWEGSGKLGRDGTWLTINGERKAYFPEGVRGTPVVRIRLLDSEVTNG